MQVGYFDSILIAVIIFHQVQAPFTKVEESFSIQAIHDILKYGISDISQYDHLQFPGVVPRSFFGPLVIAFLTKPFVLISDWYRNYSINPYTSLDTQMLARSMIGMLNGLSILYLKNCVQGMFDRVAELREEQEKKNREETRSVVSRPPDTDMTTVGSWFVVFCTVSFHLMFYFSRPLPNFVVTFSLTNVCIAWTLMGDYHWAILLGGFTAAVCRLEVVGLIAGIALASVFLKQISLVRAVQYGVFGGCLGLSISFAIDSHFWGQRCIPELDAFIFNVIEGKSIQWGSEPFLSYFTRYLRMIFLPPTVLLLNYLGFKIGPTNLHIVGFASYFHILFMSFQPHKEWRFIVYSLPGIILLGSTGTAYLWENVNAQGTFRTLLTLLLPLSALFSFLISIVFSIISQMNYPGGDALAKLNQYFIDNNIRNTTVHLSVPACMTGVSLFGQLDYDGFGIIYDKTEKPEQLIELWPSFEYLIMSEPSSDLFPAELNDTGNWEIINTTTTFSYVDSSFLMKILFTENKNIFRTIKDVVDSEVSWHDIIHKTFVSSEILYTYKKAATA
ncbi:hypothetical protein TBLA_0F04110 [Henningerozyma blattae CBS 6284]|uniref:Mannosyltransferase n=1 Tax=Henningerozyma blattae (strain ATCC 34711 / CBS 6284 / DSM 70876 / NBRC 10599 / NRRL Y-10934 / UCD 77-7) TaxID=1071380 RepID=I2H6E2_HENB6|nr:hypothetical protein TBLA_0F04110 [Tetrapisispora blattae CBS 6284]CCH61944.1 hypothetical protein TBLA_0F04110 [Tetrapisispora blattae CBS 6284]